MPILKEEITPEFIEDMVDQVIKRLGQKLDQLDMSLDYLVGAMVGMSTSDVDMLQKQQGRLGSARRIPSPVPSSED